MSSRNLHICHLTVLNPALHSRIFYKEALSMVHAGLRVTVVGQSPHQESYLEQGVEIQPFPVFAPRSIDRLLARKRIWKMACNAEADVYVLHAPELLGMGKKLKRRFPLARFVYDMHEDYPLNIREGGYIPMALQGLLAGQIERAERDFQAWGDAVVYAEKCFEGHLTMEKGSSFTLQNLFQLPQFPLPDLPPMPDELPMMLFSGTVAENWGILRALELWEALNARSPIRLVVAGVVFDEALKLKITEFVAQSGLEKRFLWWRDGEYVPHPEILSWIQRCQLGLAPYVLRKNILDRIPTRFFEYMAFGKPVVFSANPAWDRMNSLHAFGLEMEWPVQEEKVNMLLGRMHDGWQTHVPEPVWSWNAQPDLGSYLDWLRGST